MDISWMQWTPTTLYIFLGVVATLTTMTVWDVVSPSRQRKGFLPFGFTRGERLFLSVCIFLGTVILWMAYLPDTNWLFALPVAGIIILIVVIWG